jgi:hypothetical protein
VKMGRKENRRIKRVQMCTWVTHLTKEPLIGRGTHQRDNEERKQGSGMCVGNRR